MKQFKKFISVLLLTALVFAWQPIRAQAVESSALGDVDGSGTVDFFDGMVALQYYAGMIDESEIDVSAADTDGSGEVDFFDGMYILQLYAGILETLPGDVTGDITDITLKVWAPEYDLGTDSSWLPQMQKAFEEAHPEYSITWVNEAFHEGEIVEKITNDPTVLPDVYLYPNDGIGVLIQSGALTKLDGKYLAQVENDVSETYQNTVTHTDGGVYGFPITCNTWFMYYNKSLLSEEDVKSLEACLEKGIVAFPVTNSWYLPAFFFAAGGTMFGENGSDASAGIQFGGEVGLNATNAILDLMVHPNFAVDSDGSGVSGMKNGTVAAIFSGSWEYNGLYEALGDNLGAVAAPTVSINGEASRLRAYAGSKAVGVNPNSANHEAAMEFAAFLASAESQLLRFQLSSITPAVSSLADDPAVTASIVASAEMEAMEYAYAQPTIPEMNPVWGPMGIYGTNLADGYVTTDNAQEYVDTLDADLNP